VLLGYVRVSKPEVLAHPLSFALSLFPLSSIQFPSETYHPPYHQYTTFTRFSLPRLRRSNRAADAWSPGTAQRSRRSRETAKYRAVRHPLAASPRGQQATPLALGQVCLPAYIYPARHTTFPLVPSRPSNHHRYPHPSQGRLVPHISLRSDRENTHTGCSAHLRLTSTTPATAK